MKVHGKLVSIYGDMLREEFMECPANVRPAKEKVEEAEEVEKGKETDEIPLFRLLIFISNEYFSEINIKNK